MRLSILTMLGFRIRQDIDTHDRQDRICVLCFGVCNRHIKHIKLIVNLSDWLSEWVWTAGNVRLGDNKKESKRTWPGSWSY